MSIGSSLKRNVVWVTLLQERVGQYEILGKTATHFHYFHLFTPPLK